MLSFFAALSLLSFHVTQETALLPALLLPIAVHEAGHLLALRLMGFRLRSVQLEARGLCIRYAGLGGWLQEAIAALSGPLAGLVYGLLILFLPVSCAAWLEISASVSLLLTAFNLLPILPLDGGRVLYALCMRSLSEEEANRLVRGLSVAALAVLLLLGLVLLIWQKSVGLLAAGLWLVLENGRLPLVNKRKLL